MWMVFLAFVLSLAVLLIAARLFTDAAERIGVALGLSPFVIGVLIVGVGTSLPELVASVVSVSKGVSEIVSGNVIGANVSNLLLILGATAVAARTRSIDLGEQYIGIDLNFLLGSTVLLGAVMLDGRIGRLEGGLLVAGYIVFAAYLTGETGGLQRTSPVRRRVRWLDVAVLVSSAVGIYFGANWTVSNLQSLATGLGVPAAIVSVTVLSLGTTLPELLVSITASRRGQPAMAVGNVLGSCVFNALAVTGVASLVGPVSVPPSLMAFALPFMAGSTLMFYLLTQDKRISRSEGMLFLVAYTVFIVEISGLA